MEEIYLKLGQWVQNYPIIKTIVYSFILAVFFYILKTFIISNLRRKDRTQAEQILMIKKVNQTMGYLLLFSMFFLWFLQLQVFLVSLFAVAAAIVVAFKELIMCFTGGILLKASHVFKEGHRIEVDEIRGFVIEKTLLTTKILEIGPEKNSQQTTGSLITIPNSLMLSHALKNDSYFKGFSIKAFVFKINQLEKIEELEKALLQKAKELAKPHLANAKEGISKFCEQEGILIPSIEPRTKILLDDDNEFSILVKLPVLNSEVADTEQEFNRFFLHWKLKNLS